MAELESFNLDGEIPNATEWKLMEDEGDDAWFHLAS